jgi:hypothetical protein
MSRINPALDVIPVKPGNNIYTVLVVVATLVQGLALLAMFLKFNTIFTGYPFTMP